MDTEHFRRLERLYLAAPVNRPHEPEITVEDGTARIGVPVKPEQFHGGGALHGSVAFKLLDDAAFFAASSRVADELLLTASFHVHFIRPVRAGRLVARGRLVSRARKLLVAEAVVVDEREREVARGSGTFLPGGIPLTDLEDYR